MHFVFFACKTSWCVWLSVGVYNGLFILIATFTFHSKTMCKILITVQTCYLKMPQAPDSHLAAQQSYRLFMQAFLTNFQHFVVYLTLRLVFGLRMAKLFEIESYVWHYLLSSEVRHLDCTPKLSSCLTVTSFISAS
jgi:uncharacterized membrane protein YGL010W